MPEINVFLSGDVMTGRGLDQVMPHPGDPTLYERWVKSATEYVLLAEQRNGPIPRFVEPEYIWGDALAVLEDAGVSARIINLETSVTDRGEPWPDKGIHYRMHPENVACIAAANIDCCVLANNHVLDWSYPGLAQTLETLHQAGQATVGAGPDITDATRAFPIGPESGLRVLVIAVGVASSGIPGSWAALAGRPGIAFAESTTYSLVETIASRVEKAAGPEDLVIISIHWGPNWGYQIPRSHQRFARSLIDQAGVHVVHGHSSHHPLGIEVYRDRLILYGCGDLINDYEGIGGHEPYHPDLGALYLATLDTNGGRLVRLEVVPMLMRRFRLEHAPSEEVTWLSQSLSREGERLGTRVYEQDSRLIVGW